MLIRKDPGKPDGQNGTLTNPISPDGVGIAETRYRIPPREGRAIRLRAGEILVVENTHGTQVCDFWAFDSADLGLFLSLEHTRPFIGHVIPEAGDTLVDNDREPLLDFLSDTSPGVHDTLIAACDRPRFVKLGAKGYHDNCQDNLRMALMAIGLRAPEIPSPFNLWMNTPAGPDGRISWLPPVAKPGDTVRLKALRDLVAVMSACPQDMLPINAMMPNEIHFWRE
jgi:uncharacterized protein YcgI (DUF1989 family)